MSNPLLRETMHLPSFLDVFIQKRDKNTKLIIFKNSTDSSVFLSYIINRFYNKLVFSMPLTGYN
jgi:hypothetical protein